MKVICLSVTLAFNKEKSLENKMEEEGRKEKKINLWRRGVGVCQQVCDV